MGETLIGQKWCTLSSAQLEENKQKALKPLFFCSNLALVVQQPKPDYSIRTKKRGSLIVHIGVFDVLNKVLFQKLTGDVSKNTIFLQVFKVSAFAFKTLIFLCWPLLLLVLKFGVFFCLLVVIVSQIKLLRSGFCFFVFLLCWVSLLFYCVMCCVFFGLFFGFVF